MQSYFEDDPKQRESVGLSYDLIEGALGIVGRLLTQVPHEELKIARRTAKVMRENMDDLRQDHGIQDTPVLSQVLRKIEAWITDLESEQSKGGPSGPTR